MRANGLCEGQTILDGEGVHTLNEATYSGSTTGMNGLSAVEHRRARFMHWFTHATLRVIGWKLEGVPPEESKYVAVFAPHTSIWDAILGLGIRFGIEERPASWIVKDSVYRWPFRRILTWHG